MELNTLTTVLVAVVPSLSAIIAIAGGLGAIINLFKKIVTKLKDENEKVLKESNNKLLRAYDDIAILKNKILSIEKHLDKKTKE